MRKIILIVLTTILLSLYFFPFQPRVMPDINTKMVMAGVGLLVIGILSAKNRNAAVNKDFFILSIIAAIVSLIGLFSVYYNNTLDYTYASYIISMWVWLSAAYVVISLMRWVHGNVSVLLLCDYLIGLCVEQCFLALLMEFFEPVESCIYSIVDESTANFLEEKNRLSGLGVGLDVAGSRFSAILIMISFICAKYQSVISKRLHFYIFAFIFISIVGNMIARTTSVGMIMGLIYFVFAAKLYGLNSFAKRFWISFILIILLFIPIVTYSYLSIPEFHQNMRFGFEGFFSLWEKGEWDVTSNDILKNMYVFPETAKTWIIGDGYFNSTSSDPFYTGKQWKGFYMGTDVGYLRFIYYFGLLGLVAFIIYFLKVTQICIKRFPTYRVMFLLMLAINYIVWFKVSTDIFVVFAPFLCIGEEENDAYMKHLVLKKQ